MNGGSAVCVFGWQRTIVVSSYCWHACLSRQREARGMTKRQTTAIHHKPPQTTANHHKPPQTTTHHRKPPQTTTRIWDDNTSVWPCAVKKRLNHRKPPQTTTNHLQNLGLICIHVLVKSKYLRNYNRFSNSTINVFVQFVFRLFLRPLLELAITQHVAPPCNQSHCSLP